MHLRALLAIAALGWGIFHHPVHAQIPLVSEVEGKLVYDKSARGDQVPDFSCCGFEASGRAIPLVAATLGIEPSGADDTQLIQAAIDHVSATAPGSSGWRGAVQLSSGEFRVSGTLHLHGDHVVLRGSTAGSGRTTIVATGLSRRPLIVIGARRVTGEATAPRLGAQVDSASLQGAQFPPQPLAHIENYVPVGARSVAVDSVEQLRVGQRIAIEHPSTASWIAAVGMGNFPSDDGRSSWLDWKPGTIDQLWERTIVGLAGNNIELDAPLTSAIDPDLSRAFIAASYADVTCHHVGVENLVLTSETQAALNRHDEEHAWDGIRLTHTSDAWIRQVDFKHFAGSAVHVGRHARRITVADCNSREPVSEDAGWRRRTFHNLGQQVLFLRCQAEQGRHDFTTGPLASGPNAFVHCISREASSFSGAIGSWATGVLFDQVEIDGAGLWLTNRETAAQGTGWTAANSLLWNCQASTITCRQPPTAFNWAIGAWGEFAGDGIWRELNAFVSPASLFAAQLTQRVGPAVAAKVLAPCQSFPALDAERPVAPRESINVPSNSESKPTAKRLQLTNGWLAMGDRLAIGKRQSLTWWRGSVLPAKASTFGPSLTRFVPGHDEPFYTDLIPELVDSLSAQGSIALEHHWGLWYDRRRDDHQMVRRADADAWAPFYEQPWARSGSGRAWDGLSRYDLTRFNPWYFARLHEFAQQADERGVILMQYMYFQHNVLEAGAHWADFPWRPANCLQDTGFLEPPEYENRKRIFMAADFYDVSHAVRKDLHTRYIHHCLDTLGHSSNVLFFLGEEFTGPASFMRFWLDTVRHWESLNDRQVLVVLSACRDVQEEILEDPKYASLVDVIDIKYWWRTPDGSLYDPPSSTQHAPRQQLRQWAGAKAHSAESLSRTIREMRLRFPDKAVLCSVPGSDPWSATAAGASLPNLPATTDPQLLNTLLRCLPTDEANGFALAEEKLPRLFVPSLNSAPAVDSKPANASTAWERVDRDSGQPARANAEADDTAAETTSPGSLANRLPAVFWHAAD